MQKTVAKQGGGRGQSAPRVSCMTGKFLLTCLEKRGKEKRENGEKRRKIEKGKVENLKCEEYSKSYKMRRGPLDLFFFFFFLFFSLLKTTEICFGSTKMEIFYWEKAFHARKKIIRKNGLCSLRKIFLLRPWQKTGQSKCYFFPKI